MESNAFTAESRFLLLLASTASMISVSNWGKIDFSSEIIAASSFMIFFENYFDADLRLGDSGYNEIHFSQRYQRK